MNTQWTFRNLPDLSEVLDRLEGNPYCCLSLKVEPSPLPLPPEAAQFYQRCGGAFLFWHKQNEGQLLPTSYLGVLGDSPSLNHWVVVASDFKDQLICLDANPGPRQGWLRLTQSGELGPVIARSLSEFLTRVLDHEGFFYWNQPGFSALDHADGELLP